MEIYLFYFFSIFLQMSAQLVVFSTNSVQSVLFLIQAFCNSSSLQFLLGVDFVSILFVVVYVGAVAVLFLFVVMMQAPKVSISSSFDNNFNQPVGFFVLFIFFVEVVLLVSQFTVSESLFENHSIQSTVNMLIEVDKKHQIEAQGQVQYTYFFPEFILGGFILQISMQGAVGLSLQYKKFTKGQVIFQQQSREVNNAVFKYRFL